MNQPSGTSKKATLPLGQLCPEYWCLENTQTVQLFFLRPFSMSPLCRSNANSINRGPVTFLFPFCFIFLCSNLRRLVHAMILKRPPGEWLGSYRFNFLFQYLLILCFLALGCYSTITKVCTIDWQINDSWQKPVLMALSLEHIFSIVLNLKMFICPNCTGALFFAWFCFTLLFQAVNHPTNISLNYDQELKLLFQLLFS